MSKTKQVKWCDPYITGLLPLLGFIVGIILCRVGLSVNNYPVSQDEWHCTKFDDGECTRYERNPQPKVTKND